MSHHHSHCHDEHNDSHQHIKQIPTLPSQSLYKKIESSRVSGLNFVNPQDELPNLFKNSETRYQVRPIFQSDLDNQLIIKVPFVDNIKLYSVILRTNGNLANCPRSVNLYKNNDKLDFDNIGVLKPSYKFEHPLVGYIEDEDYSQSNRDEIVTDEDESTFVEHHLPRSSFTNVNQLTIFFEDNWADDDEEVLKLYSIEFRGEFTELNRAPIITTYESAANPADHKNLLKEENENSKSI